MDPDPVFSGGRIRIFPKGRIRIWFFFFKGRILVVFASRKQYILSACKGAGG